ncbi:MAG: VWA domain-containing protein [Pirellulales bacterium]|nr:VWA domain-containing protein [Pirellulales bacterium]
MPRIRTVGICLIAAGCLLAATVARAGLNVVVVLDDSGSMINRLRSNTRTEKMDAAKKALTTVVEKLPADAQVGVLLLNGNGRPNGRWVYPFGPVNADKLRSAIEPVSAHGSTPLGARMKEAANALMKRRDKQHYGTYRLLIVTDGEATDRQLVERYLPDILTRGLWVDVIGVDMASKHSLATKVHSYRRADDPATLQKALEEVFAEIGSDPSGTDESDFEMIAPIPDAMATAALTALAQQPDQPIGQRAAAKKQSLPAAQPQPVMPGGQPPFQPPVQQKDRGFFAELGSVLGWLCVGVFILIFIFVGAAASKSKRR